MKKDDKKSGILMHITSLPSDFGIGTLGKEGYKFVDFLALLGEDYWQILPIGMTGYGNSPYQSMSAFAGNINLIDLDILIKNNLISRSDIDNLDWGDNPSKVDYGKIYQHKKEVLKKAALNFCVENQEYIEFNEKNKFWLDDFACFMALKEHYDMQSFDKWDKKYIYKQQEAINSFTVGHKEQIEFFKISQFWFYKQYFALKSYANSKGIKIFGDIPFYIAYDSADLWANSHLFELDEQLKPKNVAGVPPDAFSDDGQLWGNPLYNYEEMKKDSYAWWGKRIDHSFMLYDVLRIDHFRAFDSYYAIPFPSENAKKGQWRKGVGIDFFQKLDLIGKNIVAEDLGEINDDVRLLLKKLGYPNMKVLQFAFGTDKNNEFIVKNHNENSVVYTGTHDNNTTRGWYKKATIKEKFNMLRFVPYSIFTKKSKALIRYAFSSPANTIIIPMQDYLNLDETARMNMPSTLEGNWEWRITKKQLNEKLAKKILKLKEK